MSSWSKIATWGLLGLMAVNVAGTATYFVLKAKTASAKEPPAAAAGGIFPAFSGVDVRGAQWKAGDVPCRVIRVTDDHCSFCQKDKPSYAALLDAARLASCEIIELSPKAGGMADDPRPGVVQLKFVDKDVGTALAPFVTPQTVILDRSWSLKMARRGIFDEKSLASSIALLGELARE